MGDFDGDRDKEGFKENGSEDPKSAKEAAEEAMQSLDAAIGSAIDAHRSLDAALNEALEEALAEEQYASDSAGSSASSSRLSDTDMDDDDDGGWGEPIQEIPCVAVGSTGSAELAEIANDGEESMDLFAVSWRSRTTPTKVFTAYSDPPSTFILVFEREFDRLDFPNRGVWVEGPISCKF